MIDGMVLMYLSKITQFAHIVSKTPKDVSNRKSKLLSSYKMLKGEFTGVVVSVKVPASLERFKEIIFSEILAPGRARKNYTYIFIYRETTKYNSCV